MTTSREVVPTLPPRSRAPTRDRLARVLAAACLLALLLAGVWMLVPPPARVEDTPRACP
ncbi:hypothetical protein [Deinococcus planocerae]|uniref:hypothetical protein n=1 Tax=Deinococcus planocerae TaxID=1737569 RepID=UPI0015E12E09|nr:hypothetical protein [Deinococcus planocerae]